MKELTLENVIMEIELLENDKEYWENRKLELQRLVEPTATSFDGERVDGGRRVDKISKYVELEDKYQIDETLRYINVKLDNLYRWVAKEMYTLTKHGTLTKSIVILREKTIVEGKNRKKRHLTWDEIGETLHYSPRRLQEIYKDYKKGGGNNGAERSKKTKKEKHDTKSETKTRSL